jgi:hypothetical protein
VRKKRPRGRFFTESASESPKNIRETLDAFEIPDSWEIGARSDRCRAELKEIDVEEITEPKFWLHVPFQTTRGDWLKLPTSGYVTILEHRARLCERDMHYPNSLSNPGSSVVRQWLLFDPLPESKARALFIELVRRMPVLALRINGALRIAGGNNLQECGSEYRGLYNGPMPTLIPAEVEPDPMWADLQATSYLDAEGTLGRELAACPPITDERIQAAIELVIASRYDTLPRSVFLSQLTIIDALATRGDRPVPIQAWLAEKIEEAKEFNDPGLISSLQQLKEQSHGTAVRALVGRAARLRGESPDKIAKRQKLVGTLYGIRSGLSHTAARSKLLSANVEEARRLAAFVLEAAITNPAILELGGAVE